MYKWVGQGVACGDAASLDANADNAHSLIGETIRNMFAYSRTIDVNPLAEARNNALRRRWRGETVSVEEFVPRIDPSDNWAEIQAPFPALSKGPGTYLRQFVQAEITERDAWKSYKLVLLVNSPYRACLTGDKTVRVPTSATDKALGQEILDLMCPMSSCRHQ